MVKLRLRRIGNRNRPVYRVVVADQRLPRDGRFIEEIGTYNPLQKDNNYRLDLDRVDYWLGVGAQASDTVASFIKKARKAADESPVEAVTETPAPVEEAAPVAESKNSEE
jgi:small subunit ribosomal protein S16